MIRHGYKACCVILQQVHPNVCVCWWGGREWEGREWGGGGGRGFSYGSVVVWWNSYVCNICMESI